jgi:hypothetical protein
MEKLHTIKEIASLTRQELSPFIQNNAWFDDDWACSCLVCSWVLNQILKLHGIKSELCIGNYNYSTHAFVIVEEYVVDITATQFSRPEVLVEPLHGSRYEIEYKGQTARLRMKEWPDEQRPQTYRKKLGKIIKRLSTNMGV